MRDMVNRVPGFGFWFAVYRVSGLTGGGAVYVIEQVGRGTITDPVLGRVTVGP